MVNTGRLDISDVAGSRPLAKRVHDIKRGSHVVLPPTGFDFTYQATNLTDTILMCISSIEPRRASLCETILICFYV